MSETWHERWLRVTKGRNYAAGLAMLRERGPEPTDPAQGEGQRPPLAGMAQDAPDQPSKDQG